MDLQLIQMDNCKLDYVKLLYIERLGHRFQGKDQHIFDLDMLCLKDSQNLLYIQVCSLVELLNTPHYMSKPVGHFEFYKYCTVRKVKASKDFVLDLRRQLKKDNFEKKKVLERLLVQKIDILTYSKVL